MKFGTGFSIAGQFRRRTDHRPRAARDRSLALNRWATLYIVAAAVWLSAGQLNAQGPASTSQAKAEPLAPLQQESSQTPADDPPVQAEAPARETDCNEKPLPEKDPFDRGFGEVEVPGRVIDAQGKPVAKAQIFWKNWGVRVPVRKALSDEDGHFVISTFRQNPAIGANRRLDPDEINKNRLLKTSIIATAPGYGFGTVIDGDGITIQLVPDDPIVGRVLNESGQPVRGAKVRVRDVLWPRRDNDPIVQLENRQGDGSVVPVPAGEGLDPWLSAIRQAANMNDYFVARQYVVGLIQANFLGNRPAVYAPLVPPVVTDDEGHFELRGVGRERVAELYIDGVPDHASVLVLVANRLLESPIVVAAQSESVKKLISNPGRDLTVFGRQLELTLPAGRTIQGVVTDRGTGLPLSGLRVVGPAVTRIEYPGYDRFFTTTDHEGRYRIESFPLTQQAFFKVEAGQDRDLEPIDPEELPYFSREITLNVASGTGVIQADVPLSRGIWITGKVVDDISGEGLMDATVEYHVFKDNPHLKKELEQNSPPEFETGVRTKPDGSFRLRALPGRGIVTANGFRYLEGIGADAIKGLKNDEYRETLYQPGGFSPYIRSTTIEVNIDDETATYECELRLVKGKSRVVTVIDPSGEPLTDLEASGLNHQVQNPISKIKGDMLDITNLYPGERREVVARSVSRKLMGMALVTDENDDPITLKLQPWASVSGRLVDDAGEPRSRGLRIQLDDGKLPIHTLNGLQYDKQEFLIDAEGKFEIIGMVPGATYRLSVIEGGVLWLGNATNIFRLKPDEVRQLGDVKVMKRE
ncbi:carboxypeptidase-like regulatory domain-containing protein [Schlesneria sp.]|uniref:carboxypeptidase-like regulatory domain-containing protein n=1 Tax=Schlesneria sp. TaxID=2762018 RepID=UPI002EFB05F2